MGLRSERIVLGSKAKECLMPRIPIGQPLLAWLSSKAAKAAFEELKRRHLQCGSSLY